jgi:hypothetical protein
MNRSWQRDLDQGVDTEVTRRANAHSAALAAKNPVTALERIPIENIYQYVRECLDGVVGDINAPVEYRFATDADVRVNGLTPAQHDVFAQIKKHLEWKFRRLNSSEEFGLGMAVIGEFNRRARDARNTVAGTSNAFAQAS